MGLDIGTDSIKVAEAKFARDGITITGLGIARTPEGIFDNEVITDPKALGDAIKALLNESGIKTKKCVSSVSGASQVVVRVISVPKMNDAELAETMKWEVERQVPFSPSEVVMDFQALNLPSADPAASEMDVLLAVAQQQLIENHVEALRSAGLKPTAIDIEPLASSRALIELSANAANDETVAVVNIGATRTDMGVFENGILTFPSPPIGVAGINFTREISEAMGQTLEQAEITKREFAAVNLGGFEPEPEPEPEPVAPAIESTIFDTAFSSDPEPKPESAAPTTESLIFDTVVSPDPESATAFDLGDAVEELAAEPASAEDFGAPTFDLADESGPSFDLGGPIEETAPPAVMFDLDDDGPEPEPEDSSEPNFDLSDAGSETDHGRQVDPVVPNAAPAPVVSGFEDGSTEAEVFKAISGVLVDLASELRMSLDYYTNRYGKTPDRVYLCGGTARMPNLDVFLSQELGVLVEVADPVKNLPVQVPGASPQYLEEISPMLSVSIGLAIRDMIG